MAALSEKVERVLENIDHIMEHHSNLDQFLQTLAACFDDSKIMSTHSPASDPIDHLTPMPMPVFVNA